MHCLSGIMHRARPLTSDLFCCCMKLLNWDQPMQCPFNLFLLCEHFVKQHLNCIWVTEIVKCISIGFNVITMNMFVSIDSVFWRKIQNNVLLPPNTSGELRLFGNMKVMVWWITYHSRGRIRWFYTSRYMCRYSSAQQYTRRRRCTHTVRHRSQTSH